MTWILAAHGSTADLQILLHSLTSCSQVRFRVFEFSFKVCISLLSLRALLILPVSQQYTIIPFPILHHYPHIASVMYFYTEFMPFCHSIAYLDLERYEEYKYKRKLEYNTYPPSQLGWRGPWEVVLGRR
jgi:hypothetical protein